MARGEEAVKEHARRLLPVNRGAWVIDRTLKSLHEGTARLGDRETSSLDPDQLWAETTDRGRGRHAHGFTFFADWVGAAPQVDSAEATALSRLVHSTVLGWDARFGLDRRASAPEMAYHDETTAQRLLGVVAALDIMELDERVRTDLLGFAHRTAAVLSEPDFHSGLNNHGMFQDLALLTWSILVAPLDDPAGSTAWELAEARLDAYFESCFTSEGVHVENTPTYHVMVARYLPILEGIFDSAGTPSAELYRTLHTGAERYAVHCVTPEGLYPPVSDTQRRRLDTDFNLGTFTGGEFEYATTRGSKGRKPVVRTVAFPASGYVMSRSAWGEDDASFVYFSCAYNADYHKHSDELSIFLRSGGRDLLCEAGPYGYNWKDPVTKYAYSSAAHNTMLVDGSGLPRTESLEEREGPRAPLDSMAADVVEDDLLDATGTTRRYRGRTWSRRLRVTHGDAPNDTVLRVEDDVASQAGAANLRFLWHLGPDLSIVPGAHGAEVFAGTEKVMEIDIRTDADISLGVAEGVEENSQLQGWYCPTFGEKVPAAVLTVDCWQEDVSLTTTFRLSGFDGESEERSALRPLIETGPALPAWSSETDGLSGAQAVVVLGASSAAVDRHRYTAELSKSSIPHWYVPGVGDLLGRAESPDGLLTTIESIAESVSGLIRREARRGVEVLIATVDESFAPGAVAAMRTGAPLWGIEPQIPFEASDARHRRVVGLMRSAVVTASATSLRFLISGEAKDASDLALASISAAEPERHDLSTILPADAEDRFSDVLRNEVEVAQGHEVRYLVGYDRRSGRFLIDLLGDEADAVAVRVFHGKDEVASMPYTAGSSHQLEYRGHGPHRLRLHVRDAEGVETAAFTTGTVRVR